MNIHKELKRSINHMLYSNSTIVLSTASLVGMDAEMDEDDAEFLEQGVKDESCAGMETPDLTSEKEKLGNSQSTIESDSDDLDRSESIGGNHSVSYSSSNHNLSRSSIDDIPLLPDAMTVDPQSEERYLSNSLFSNFEAINVNDNEQQGLNIEEGTDALRIPQDDFPYTSGSQTGCISSESQKICPDLSSQEHVQKSRRQSASQSTAESQTCGILDSTSQEALSESLQVITEGVEANFHRTSLIDMENEHLTTTKEESTMRNSKSMDRLLSEAAQFAEAVGEIPPSNFDEISRQIIDPDEDDDDSISTSAELTSDRIQGNLHQNDTDVLDLTDASGMKSTQELALDCSVDDSDLPVEKESNRLERKHKRERSKSMDETKSKNFSRISDRKASPRKTYLADESNMLKLHSKLFESLSNKKALHEKSLLDGLAPAEEAHNNENKNSSSYVYRGLICNPPAITQRGISRGNYAQLHRKAWLEVSDKYHRYGKNLRLYYKHWESLNHPTNMFFDWLDCKGEAAGQPLPNLEECPRSQLDSDTVLYITNPDITERYKLTIEANENGVMRIVDKDGNPVDTGHEGWIFVLRDGVLYAAPKVTSVSGKSKQRFHHSSFFGGKAVAAAGIIITDKIGVLQRLYPHSGHYRPGEAHMHRMLFFIQKSGIDLFSFQVDTQQIMHVSRKESPKGGKRDETKTCITAATETKSKKVNNLHLRSGATVACLLAHKAHMISYGIFAQIHKIRRMKQPICVTSVLEKIVN